MTADPTEPSDDTMTALADIGSLVQVASDATVSRTVLKAEGTLWVPETRA